MNRKRKFGGKQPQPYEPTAEEIECRKAEIQARWSDAERRRRIVCKPVKWEVPAVDDLGVLMRGSVEGEQI